MSKKKNKSTKKVIVPTKSKKTIPTKSKVKARTTVKTHTPKELIFGKQNYLMILGGIILVALGLMLMVGGEQAPNEWNPDDIYSTRRTVIAPMVILAGLILEIFAIFQQNKAVSTINE